MNYIIRKRTREDCAAIARVVTISWNETYRGIVPDFEVDNLFCNEEERAKSAYDEFDDSNNNQLILEVNNEVVGFVNYGKTDDDFDNCGEIFALYIIGKYKGFGFGRKLVEEAKKELKLLGYDKMVIACLKGNPSNEFYKHIGGVFVKERIYERLNLLENVYYFEKLSEVN